MNKPTTHIYHAQNEFITETSCTEGVWPAVLHPDPPLTLGSPLREIEGNKRLQARSGARRPLLGDGCLGVLPTQANFRRIFRLTTQVLTGNTLQNPRQGQDPTLASPFHLDSEPWRSRPYHLPWISCPSGKACVRLRPHQQSKSALRI